MCFWCKRLGLDYYSGYSLWSTNSIASISVLSIFWFLFSRTLIRPVTPLPPTAPPSAARQAPPPRTRQSPSRWRAQTAQGGTHDGLNNEPITTNSESACHSAPPPSHTVAPRHYRPLPLNLHKGSPLGNIQRRNHNHTNMREFVCLSDQDTHRRKKWKLRSGF